MGKIVDVQAPFASLQVTAGARCIQVFDSLVGALGPDDYVRFVQPYSRALIERIRATGVPVIHFGTGASGFFRELHAASGDVMGVDWRVNIDQAWTDLSLGGARQPGSCGSVRAAAGAADEDRRAAALDAGGECEACVEMVREFKP